MVLVILSANQHRGSDSDNTHASGSQTKQLRSMRPPRANNSKPVCIEDLKLWYERRWLHRGQSVYADRGKDIPLFFSGNIAPTGFKATCVKKTSDGRKVRIYLPHLRRGKVSLKQRAKFP